MSAPDNAITLREEAKGGEDENHSIFEESVISQCGFAGVLRDLLYDPDDEHPTMNDLWCPKCRSRDWQFC